MIAPPQGTGHGIIVHRRNLGEEVDHIYIACLECRFVGTWQVDSSMHYTASGENAEVRLVELNGTRKYIKFRYLARVTLLPSNVLTYQGEDEMESVYVDEDKKM